LKQIALSDHAADKAQLAADKRRSDYEAQVTQYNRLTAQRERKAVELWAKSQTIWNEKRYFAWFFSLFARLAHACSPKPARARMALADDQERAWLAGSEGERRIDGLFGVLGDEWTLIGGYKNFKGEIDKILVGAQGVLAIEIKTINGVIYVDGDRWYRDKYDRYGNCVETGIPIADKGGRSPSMQVNASADVLERFLAQRANIKRVARAVILAHERSQIGGINNQTVELIGAPSTLRWSDIAAAFPKDNPIDVEAIVKLICKDHDYQEKRRREQRR
jgi:hypothetical protein